MNYLGNINGDCKLQKLDYNHMNSSAVGILESEKRSGAQKSYSSAAELNLLLNSKPIEINF